MPVPPLAPGCRFQAGHGGSLSRLSLSGNKPSLAKSQGCSWAPEQWEGWTWWRNSAGKSLIPWRGHTPQSEPRPLSDIFMIKKKKTLYIIWIFSAFNIVFNLRDGHFAVGRWLHYEYCTSIFLAFLCKLLSRLQLNLTDRWKSSAGWISKEDEEEDCSSKLENA